MNVAAETELPEPLEAGTYRALVDVHLRACIRDAHDRVGDAAPQAVVLVDELRRLLDAGGKRIRPLFCFWGYRAGGSTAVAGADLDPIARAGAAVELLHMSALIHDDVIDGSPLRRGSASSFRRLAGALPGSDGSSTDPDGERFGRSSAILAGDLAQALADDLLATSGFPAERIVRAFGSFDRMRVDAVQGEFLDLLAAGTGRITEEGARRIGALKSGSYTVVGPLRIGAALAGGPAEVADSLAAYGELLGVAFQFRDDVLGTFGDPRVTGKDRDGDIREGKQTVLVATARRLATRAEREVLIERMGRRDLTASEVEDVREVIRSSGALAATIAVIDDLAAQATSCLRASRLAPEVVAALDGLADLVALRDA